METNESSSVRIERLRRASDPRGFVFEPLSAGELASQRNVHVVITQPGEIRGNHFHRKGTEITAASGPTRVIVKEGGETRAIDVPEGETWRFTFPPGITHAFINTGSAPSVLVSFNTQPHEPDAADVVRDVIAARD